jgi:hypothetical protein
MISRVISTRPQHAPSNPANPRRHFKWRLKKQHQASELRQNAATKA